MRNRGGGRGYNHGNDDFEKGTAQPQRSREEEDAWRKETEKERKEILAKSKATFDRITKDKSLL